MNKKEQQAQRAKQEDVVLNKVLWWIVGAVVLEVLLLLLNKVYANYTVEQIELAKSLRDVFSVLMIALPICFVVLLIWAVVARKSGKFTRLSSVLAGVMLALAVCAVVIRVFDESGIRLLYVAVPAVAVLALIYYLYQREFFFAAVLSALGLLGVKVVPYHFGFPAIAYGYAVVLGVALVGAAVVFRVMQAAEGKLRLKGNWVEVLPKSANPALRHLRRGGRGGDRRVAAGRAGRAVRCAGGLAAAPGGILYRAPHVMISPRDKGASRRTACPFFFDRRYCNE